MASNYKAICEENQRRYGTDIGRIGPMLLADRYDDRTHFIFELLQNAEDALGRRDDSTGPRKVTFELAPTRLSVSHFGMPVAASSATSLPSSVPTNTLPFHTAAPRLTTSQHARLPHSPGTLAA